ncbi:hypothetical protein [Streptomyces bicolor]|uniref:hypothetical protein n=1 Tax=Streptomyces bicolor TaxID=66874 RepID=UPI000D144EAF|nr:hypothetical protein [Streptomyces bicolor]
MTTPEPLRAVPGSPPHLFTPTPGCAFAPRCSRATAAASDARRHCDEVRPRLTADSGHAVACHLPLRPATTKNQPRGDTP